MESEENTTASQIAQDVENRYPFIVCIQIAIEKKWPHASPDSISGFIDAACEKAALSYSHLNNYILDPMLENRAEMVYSVRTVEDREPELLTNLVVACWDDTFNETYTRCAKKINAIGRSYKEYAKAKEDDESNNIWKKTRETRKLSLKTCSKNYMQNPLSRSSLQSKKSSLKMPPFLPMHMFFRSCSSFAIIMTFIFRRSWRKTIYMF